MGGHNGAIGRAPAAVASVLVSVNVRRHCDGSKNWMGSEQVNRISLTPLGLWYVLPPLGGQEVEVRLST